MRRLFVALSVAAVLALSASAALAHDMWGTADNPTPGQPLKAQIGYGHHYPAMEVIDDQEFTFFKLSVIGAGGPIKTSPGTPNYNFTTDAPVDKGTYLVVADVAPIYWSQTPSGWSMKPKDESPGATSCGLFIEGAKGVVVVGDDASAAVATKPVGLPIEIVPLAHPSTVKPGGKLTLQVLLDGKPLAGAEVKGRYGAFSTLASETAMAYSDTTDQEGKVTFVPLAAGDWIVTARSEKPFDQPTKCDKTDWGTSLHFIIN
ncbi:MAG: DUF4198 domain-containing protein [Deltaproteobacteria bacterium]|jgi:uncharacterized GH25 family protein|nr:DUF4198 domain-containing protein [Deltaproteobacteria bacterium]